MLRTVPDIQHMVNKSVMKCIKLKKLEVKIYIKGLDYILKYSIRNTLSHL